MRHVQLFFFSGLVLLAVGTGLQFAWHGIGDNPLPVLGRVEKFALTDVDGSRFGTKQLKKKVWIANFFFSRCGSVCPAINGEVAKLYRKYRNSDKFQVVSITVDPEYDSPEILAEYGKRFAADPEQWHMLSGPEDKIREVIRVGFKLGMGETADQHTTRIVLVDGKRRVRGYYLGLEPEAIQELEGDLERLLAEG